MSMSWILHYQLLHSSSVNLDNVTKKALHLMTKCMKIYVPCSALALSLLITISFRVKLIDSFKVRSTLRDIENILKNNKTPQKYQDSVMCNTGISHIIKSTHHRGLIFDTIELTNYKTQLMQNMNGNNTSTNSGDSELALLELCLDCFHDNGCANEKEGDGGMEGSGDVEPVSIHSYPSALRVVELSRSTFSSGMFDFSFTYFYFCFFYFFL